MPDSAAYEKWLETLVSPNWVGFDSIFHRYWEMPTGKRIPSVTEVLKAAGLAWYPPDNDMAKKIGTETHSIIHSWEMEGKEVLPRYWGVEEKVYAYKKFREETGAKVLESEMIVASKELWVAGTLDKVMEINGQVGILEIKTGGPRPWDALQVAGYSLCVPGAPFKWVLYLRDDGEYRLKSFGADFGAESRFIFAAHEANNKLREEKAL